MPNDGRFAPVSSRLPRRRYLRSRPTLMLPPGRGRRGRSRGVPLCALAAVPARYLRWPAAASPAADTAIPPRGRRLRARAIHCRMELIASFRLAQPLAQQLVGILQVTLDLVLRELKLRGDFSALQTVHIPQNQARPVQRLQRGHIVEPLLEAFRLGGFGVRVEPAVIAPLERLTPPEVGRPIADHGKEPAGKLVLVDSIKAPKQFDEGFAGDLLGNFAAPHTPHGIPEHRRQMFSIDIVEGRHWALRTTSHWRNK